jgi:hypothetical protein
MSRSNLWRKKPTMTTKLRTAWQWNGLLVACVSAAAFASPAAASVAAADDQPPPHDPQCTIHSFVRTGKDLVSDPVRCLSRRPTWCELSATVGGPERSAFRSDSQRSQ